MIRVRLKTNGFGYRGRIARSVELSSTEWDGVTEMGPLGQGEEEETELEYGGEMTVGRRK